MGKERKPAKLNLPDFNNSALPTCKAEVEYLSVRSRVCKKCADLNTAGLKLSTVEISNLPQLPHQTNYPFIIAYDSLETGLPCIQFEVRETVIGGGSKIEKVSNSKTNEHMVVA